MLTSPETCSKLDRTTFTITFERSIAASRDQVFDAWTKPEHVTEWWDPTGAPLAECVIDPKPGGAFRFVNRDHAHGPPFAGTYRTLERPSRIVFDAMGAVGTVLLESRGATTHLTVTIRCSSAEQLEQMVKVGVDTGTNQTLDNLVVHLHKAN